MRKRQPRLNGIDNIVLSLTARGLTTGEVAAHFAEVYGARVSKDTISRITDKVIEEMTEWRNRPLDRWRMPLIVANQLAMRCLRHRAMTCSGVRSLRHSRGRSLSSSATSRRRLPLMVVRS